MTTTTSLRNIIVLGVALFALVGYNYINAAWTKAPSSPPSNNVKAPVNVGSVPQTKNGSFATQHSLYASTSVQSDKYMVAQRYAATASVWSPKYCDRLGHNCFTATDVANPVATASVAPGAWCGLQMSEHGRASFKCDGHSPVTGCPAGYGRTLFARMGSYYGGDWYTCVKSAPVHTYLNSGAQITNIVAAATGLSGAGTAVYFDTLSSDNAKMTADQVCKLAGPAGSVAQTNWKRFTWKSSGNNAEFIYSATAQTGYTSDGKGGYWVRTGAKHKNSSFARVVCVAP